MFLGSVLAVAADGLRAVFGHIRESGAWTTTLTARNEYWPRFGKLLEVGLMLFVPMLAHAHGLGADENAVHSVRVAP